MIYKTCKALYFWEKSLILAVFRGLNSPNLYFGDFSMFPCNIHFPQGAIFNFPRPFLTPNEMRVLLAKSPLKNIENTRFFDVQIAKKPQDI